MPRAWLHRQTRCSRMPTELTIMRSDNPSNGHPKFASDASTSVAVHRRRIVSRGGNVNVTSSNIPNKHKRYYTDLFTTTLDLPFHWIILIYSAVYLISWSGFGTIWWLIYYIRSSNGYEDFYCVDNVDSWTTAFLFSIETQTTIGYGGRQVTSNCPEGVILLLIQTLVGSFIAATLLGLVFAKASRPKKRSSTVLFSENAVIGKRNDHLCLMFRVGDLRKSQLLECHLQMEMFYTRETSEGVLPYFQERLPLGNGFTESSDTYYTFLLLPNVIAHVIDEESPLYGMTRLDLLKANVELVVIVEGVIESTGLTMQARASYTANEILWGYNFVNLPRAGSPVYKGQLTVDFAYFNEVEPAKNMPRCSAKEHQELKNRGCVKPNGKVVPKNENSEEERTQNDLGSTSKPVSSSDAPLNETVDPCEVISNGHVANSGLQIDDESEKTSRSEQDC